MPRRRVLQSAGRVVVATAAVCLTSPTPAWALDCTEITDCLSNSARGSLSALVGVGMLALLLFAPEIGVPLFVARGLVEGVTGEDVVSGEPLDWKMRALGLLPVAGEVAGEFKAVVQLERGAVELTEVERVAAEAAKIEQVAAEGAIPRGFASAGEFGEFGGQLRGGLAEVGFGDTEAAFQGSSVTGQSFRTGEPFDVGRVSDFDIALGGEEVFSAAREAGIGVRGGGIRTGPLSALDLERLGLTGLRADLSGLAGRPVNFMIYRSIEGALARSASILVP